MIRWSARHPIVPAALAGICVCLGLASVWRMPIAYLPGTPSAPLWISFRVPAQPGQEVVLARLVRPLSARLAATPGIEHHSCQIGSGWAGCQVSPTAGTDDEQLAARLRELAAVVAGSGPEHTSSRVWRARPEAERPGLIVQLTGVKRRHTQEELLPLLHQVEGLRTVGLFPHRSNVVRLVATGHDETDAVRTAVRHASRSALYGSSAIGPVVGPSPPASLQELLDLLVPVGSRLTPLGELVQPSLYLPEPRLRYRVNGQEGLFLVVHDDPSRPRRSALAAAREQIDQ